MFKWPPKQSQALSKAIQDRFKARTPKGRQDHYLKLTDELTGFEMSIRFTNKKKLENAFKALKEAEYYPRMDMISKPKLGEGEYIPS